MCRNNQEHRPANAPSPASVPVSATSPPHDPGTVALWEWFETIPLSNTWSQCSASNQERLLTFWLLASEDDPWTFEQLKLLLGELLEASGTIPSILCRWGLEVAVGLRAAPRRTGPKGDRTRDARIAAILHCYTKFAGISRVKAAKRVGAAISLSPEAVESARRRHQMTEERFRTAPSDCV